MWRFLRFLLQAGAVVAVAALSFLAMEKAAIPGAGGIANGIVAAAGGMILGLIFGWLRSIPWHRLPVMFRAWRLRFANQCAWAALGIVSVAVLVYY